MYNKRINIWKSVSILILIKKDIWAFSSYSHSLKTANLKHTRISRWKFTLYGAWTIHAYLCARCFAVPQTENRLWMVPPFFIALWYTSENLSKRNLAQFENLGELVKNTIFVAWNRTFNPLPLHWRCWACSFLQACLTILTWLTMSLKRLASFFFLRKSLPFLKSIPIYIYIPKVSSRK